MRQRQQNSRRAPYGGLILIGHSEILPKLFDEILIPLAVATELKQASAPESVRSWIAAPPEWLQIRPVGQSQLGDLQHLGAGEREAILLAEEAGAAWLIMDDHDGRQEAAHRGLAVIGTLRLLDDAAERSQINTAEAVTRLQQTTF